MYLQNEICNIKIDMDTTFTVDSVDNRHYDLILNLDRYNRNDFYKVLSITGDLYLDKISIALVGDFYTYETDCAILDKDILTVLQNDMITQINIIDRSVILHKKFESLGCNCGIYKVNSGYIIYGEIEITMLDFEFNKKWAFSGRDIFVSLSRKKAFEICEDRIKLYDFEDNYYELDFEGNVIN